MVFLDYQSSTPLLPAALEAMRPYFTEHFGAPASLHRHGLKAREALARAREQFAGMLGASSPEEIIFTSGGTESANLAVQGAARANRRRGDHIILTEIEHPAVLNSVQALEQEGFTSTRVQVDGEGRLNPDDIRAALTDRTILICLHHANHDLGTVQPVAEIGRLAAERGIAFFVDATASGGWLPLEAPAWGAGLVSLSPHRFYGPKGVGVLYRHRARISNVLYGGNQEGGLRPGTENVPAIVGAGVAAEIAVKEVLARGDHTRRLQTRLWAGLKERISHLRLNGPEPGPHRSPVNLNVSVEFLEGEGLMLRCDLKGLALASGSSCVSKSLKMSHVLRAIGLEPALAQGNVIFSLGKDTTEEEIAFAVQTVAQAVTDLRELSPAWQELPPR